MQTAQGLCDGSMGRSRPSAPDTDSCRNGDPPGVERSAPLQAGMNRHRSVIRMPPNPGGKHQCHSPGCSFSHLRRPSTFAPDAQPWYPQERLHWHLHSFLQQTVVLQNPFLRLSSLLRTSLGLSFSHMFNGRFRVGTSEYQPSVPWRIRKLQMRRSIPTPQNLMRVVCGMSQLLKRGLSQGFSYSIRAENPWRRFSLALGPQSRNWRGRCVMV